jgi:hypothetical protein
VRGVDAQLGLLLRLELRRRTDPLRHRGTGAAAALLPALVGVVALRLGAESLRPASGTLDGALGISLLVAGIVAFQAYPVLLRPGDDAFLRHLGIRARAMYRVRALRLLALALLIAGVVLVPFVGTGEPFATAAVAALASAIVAWGCALFTTAGAARAMSAPGGPGGAWGRAVPLPPGLRAAAPMLWAPLGPLLLGGFAGRVAAGPLLPAAAAFGLAGALGAALAAAGAGRFERGYPRIAPLAAEMAFAPPAEAGDAGLAIDRGIAVLLPRRARAARARDAAVLGRRFRGAARVGWGVGIVGALVLLRAGGVPAVRGWVVGAAVLVLVGQGAALLGLGRLERGGPRWIDRSVGVGTAARLVGRWGAGFGMALTLAAPLGIAWAIGVPGGGAWLWPFGAALLAGAGATASLAAGGR